MAVQIENYEPFPKQAEFHRSPAKYRLFGGAAGPGKSRALLEEACLQAWEVNGADTLLLRRTFPELEASLLSQFRRHILPQWRDVPGFRFNESEHIARWPNGSTTRFGYCSSEKDVYQYQGGEFLFIGVDELTLFTLGMWQFLTSRNRCAVAGTFPNMAGASNPGNIGHVWVKSLWIEKKPAPGMERPQEYDAKEYDFIRARIEDNPIYAEDASYNKTLESLPAALFRAFKLGDWDVFAGQYFDIWNYAENTVLRKDVEIKPWWPSWWSIDWGYAHPCSAHRHWRDGDIVYTGKEVFDVEMSEDEIGERLINASRGPDGKVEKISAVFLSPDAFAKRTSQNTIAERLGEVLHRGGLPRPAHADNDREGGWRLMYEMLRARMWFIFRDECPKLIECLPTLIRDGDKLEDILKVDQGEGQIGDDAADDCRYGLKTMLNPRATPIDVINRARLAEVPDRHARAMLALRLNADMQKAQRTDGIPANSRSRRARLPR
jgi:phage terminase large subunit